MLIFDQLRISDNGKRLYINAHINKASMFDKITLESITIITADKVSETNPLEPTEDYIYKHNFEEGEREVNMVLTAADFLKKWEEDPKAMLFKEADMSNTLFFVYIKCTGATGDCTPCRLDEDITLGVTFDESVLYQRVMDYTKALTDDCTVPVGFMDFILLWYAFKAAIETEHYVAAIKFYNMLFGTIDNRSTIKGCGCHG
jgi:hypothetical protein